MATRCIVSATAQRAALLPLRTLAAASKGAAALNAVPTRDIVTRSSYSKAIVLGTVGKDPTFRAFGSSQQQQQQQDEGAELPPDALGSWSFSIATDRFVGRSEDGAVQRATDWHSVRLRRKKGDPLFGGSLVRKGSVVLVEGRLSYWRTEEGRSGVVIEGDSINVVSSPASQEQQEEAQGQAA
ncbi:hypothetical protein DFJ73DRAFT_835370 [Zopfochytrium polystomum]|nr:hypothetical protein DFJ73DRAFT_835370 [Zopfochytrium polystomum]